MELGYKPLQPFCGLLPCSGDGWLVLWGRYIGAWRREISV